MINQSTISIFMLTMFISMTNSEVDITPRDILNIISSPLARELKIIDNPLSGQEKPELAFLYYPELVN